MQLNLMTLQAGPPSVVPEWNLGGLRFAWLGKHNLQTQQLVDVLQCQTAKNDKFAEMHRIFTIVATQSDAVHT